MQQLIDPSLQLVADKADFDSYMVATADLKDGQLRLLATTQYLRLPVGEVIRFLITSDDVIHS
jgi:heme/copper-type cytochrome/quinol oxidase subunit 2